MRNMIVLSVAALLLGAHASEAVGKDKKGKGPQVFCQFHPRAEWMPLLQITDKAKTMGYEVWKVEEKQGCWEVHGYDKNGASVRVSFDPKSGQVMSTRDRF